MTDRLRRAAAALAYLLACGLATLFVLARLGSGAVDTDIQNLLPSGALDPVVRAAMVQAGAAASSRVALVVEAKDPERARTAAADLTAQLKASGVYVDTAADGEQTARWLFANRNALVCPPDPQGFDAAAAQETAQTSLATLYAPAAPIDADLLQRDPFLLTLRLSGCLLPRNQVGRSGDAVLVSGRLLGSAYRVDTQDRFLAVVDRWTREQAPHGVVVARAGAAFHASRAAAHAKGDMTTIGVASTLAIFLLLLGVFRRPAVLAFALLVVAGGYVGSLALTLAVFKSVNILVFVFGAAFVGVTADYALYWLSTGPQTNWAGPAVRRRLIFWPVGVCMATSALGFVCLALFDMAIFRQLAVFAIGGLVSAWTCAFTVLPRLDRGGSPQAQARWTAAWRRAEAFAGRLTWNRRRLRVFAAVAAVATGVGGLRFATLDDIRRFQPPAPDLIADEAKVRAVVGPGLSQNFLLSRGPTLDAAKAAEQSVLARLSPQALGEVLAVSRLDPPPAQRAVAAQRLKTLLIDPNLARRAALLGLKIDPYAGAGGAPLPAWLSDLEGRSGDVRYLIAPVGEGAAREAAAAAARNPATVYVEPVAAYGRAFAAYRLAAAQAVALAFAVIAAALLLIYRTPRALSIMAAPAIGAVGGLVVSSALGVPISFFSLMGVFVVIGTGADYSVLQWEWSRRVEPAHSRLPILITATTSILSMGALSLSATYPVHAFGVVVAAGLTIAYAFSFIPRQLGSLRRP
jgi:predicted exporter